MQEHYIQDMQAVALSMFRKDFVGIFHGSLSAKIDHNRFLINSKDAIFDKLTHKAVKELYFNIDYRWSDASIDAHIHKSIYQKISDAKFISYSMPIYTTAYSINNQTITPKDYFGATNLGEVEIVDPNNFDDWYERASIELVKYFLRTKKEIVVVKGYGVYAYDRDIFALVKKIALLENSVKILMLAHKDIEISKKNPATDFQGSGI